MTETDAAELLARSRALLLDFDGPICSVFAGIPAHAVADQLRTVLADGGHTKLAEKVANAKDPFDVFRYAATLGDNEARYVEAAFTAHEVEAIATAVPTSGAHDLMRAWHESNRPIAIVSNNSLAAICSYLDLYGLRPWVEYVSARISPCVNQLKPNPYLLRQAIRSLGVTPDDCVLVGDSVSDISAAQAVGIASVGYANKSDKNATLRNAGASRIISAIPRL